jgi:thiosulfate/3-mercaptopyruvate sulfurtransferase
MTDAFFVSINWLKRHQGRRDITIVDASWHLTAANRDARADFLAEHIVGAVRFDINEVANASAALPRTVPDPAEFGRHMDRFGIRRTDHVVLYDTLGLYSAPRVWWMFRLYGHESVSILAGGFPAWQAAGGPIEGGTPQPPAARRPYTPTLRPEMLKSIEAVAEISRSGSAQIIDLRAAGAFAGSDTPRAGHIPGSINLPFGTLVDPLGTLLSPNMLKAAFEAAGIADDRPLVFTCGSGVTACIGALAAEVSGRRDWSVFGGSWAEWSGREDLLVERA